MSSVSTTGPRQRRSRFRLASLISVSLSLVSWVNSGEVSGVDCDRVGEGATVYGVPKAGFIPPEVKSGETGDGGGDGLARGGELTAL